MTIKEFKKSIPIHNSSKVKQALYELFGKREANFLFKELIEYNSNTSAGHPVKDDDIVRYSEETQRVKDKEP